MKISPGFEHKQWWASGRDESRVEGGNDEIWIKWDYFHEDLITPFQGKISHSRYPKISQNIELRSMLSTNKFLFSFLHYTYIHIYIFFLGGAAPVAYGSS